MTYKEAYNKIIDAYFKDEIQPMNGEFCFCGTLSPDSSWRFNVNPDIYPYKGREYEEMEYALLRAINPEFLRVLPTISFKNRGKIPNGQIPLYENQLFQGMSNALDVLKEIHRERGEDVDEETVKFKKRELFPA